MGCHVWMMAVRACNDACHNIRGCVCLNLIPNKQIMSPNATVKEENAIYPGGYVPRSDMENCYHELCVHAGDTDRETPAEVEEDGDCFRVSVSMPGLKREDILIFVHDHILSISVSQQHPPPETQNVEETAAPAEWHIHLPKTADAEFISAEYREGMLNLVISKGVSDSRVNDRQVVVY
jgi:HSP20 family molecular chaperone IbpA